MANKDKTVAAEGAEMIREGHVYKEDNSNKEVIPFHVDFGTSTVVFAPVGSGREDRMRTSDFLGRFTYQGQFSARAEKQKGETAEDTRTARTTEARTETKAVKTDKEA